MSNELYRDFIDRKADSIINSLGGTITPAPVNPELYRDFLDRKFDDVINACNGLVKLKTFTYKGTGLTSNTITIPDDLTMVLSIKNINNDNDQTVLSNNLIRNDTCLCQVHVTNNKGTSYINLSNRVRWTSTELLFVSNNNSSPCAFNMLDVDYTVYYI